MIICIDTNDDTAYVGKTAEEAYRKYLEISSDSGDVSLLEDMKWYSATPMKCELKLSAIPAKPSAAKPKANPKK